MVILKQKEIQAKMAHEANEKAQLEMKSKTMSEEEEKINKNLNVLTEEQRQLQLQLMNAADHQRRCQIEEPLLLKYATEKLQSLEEEELYWKQKFDELTTLRETWSGDKVLSSLNSQIETLTNEIQQCQKERKGLEEAYEEDRKRLEHMTKSHLTKEYTPASPTNRTGGGAELRAQSIADTIRKEEFEFAQEELKTTRYRAALQREVEDLASRTEELEQWQQEVRKETEKSLKMQRELQQCVEHKKCSACLHAS
ncbi:hypothetical protein AGDE_14344 [Angomonas deanei]|nr:hypothetical protein AGDE_14344 [Angomonas deanei]|eukprot:EPY21012.1 hypothetical protein AGDE_14344 [Angomonas deanei]